MTCVIVTNRRMLWMNEMFISSYYFLAILWREWSSKSSKNHFECLCLSFRPSLCQCSGRTAGLIARLRGESKAVHCFERAWHPAKNLISNTRWQSFLSIWCIGEINSEKPTSLIRRFGRSFPLPVSLTPQKFGLLRALLLLGSQGASSRKMPRNQEGLQYFYMHSSWQMLHRFEKNNIIVSLTLFCNCLVRHRLLAIGFKHGRAFQATCAFQEVHWPPSLEGLGCF